MKVVCASMLLAVLMSGPAFAQAPQFNMMADAPGKTPDQIERQKALEKAYRESLRKIPDAAVVDDPWGGVRNTSQSKTTSKSRQP
ncbi:hypothetical protein [Nitrobacter sp.]|uniref:hypothetical protein n=1 Tax=unclassified Nitrobacter TaxID=2620411 RepID=UPI0032204DA3